METTHGRISYLELEMLLQIVYGSSLKILSAAIPPPSEEVPNEMQYREYMFQLQKLKQESTFSKLTEHNVALIRATRRVYGMKEVTCQTENVPCVEAQSQTTKTAIGSNEISAQTDSVATADAIVGTIAMPQSVSQSMETQTDEQQQLPPPQQLIHRTTSSSPPRTPPTSSSQKSSPFLGSTPPSPLRKPSPPYASDSAGEEPPFKKPRISLLHPTTSNVCKPVAVVSKTSPPSSIISQSLEEMDLAARIQKAFSEGDPLALTIARTVCELISKKS